MRIESPSTVIITREGSAAEEKSRPSTPVRGAIPGEFPSDPLTPQGRQIGSLAPSARSSEVITLPERQASGNSRWRAYADKWPAVLQEMDLERGAEGQLFAEERAASASPSVPEEPVVRRSGRTTRKPLCLSAYLGVPSSNLEEAHLTMTQALESPASAQWEVARRRELAQLEKYSVY